MRREILEILKCPFHGDHANLEGLGLEVSSSGNILNGQLRCNSCKRVFAVKNGIPNFLPEYNPKQLEQKRSTKTWQEGRLLNSILKKRSKEDKMNLSYMRSGKVLDIGCGGNPQGSVNVDIYISSNLKDSDNFVLCAAEYLPFKDACFDYVISASVLPYCRDPYRFFAEQIRVMRLGALCIVDNCDWFGNFILKFCNKGHSFDWNYYTQWSCNTISNFLNQFDIEKNIGFSNQNNPLILNIISFLRFIPRLKKFFNRHLIININKTKKEGLRDYGK